MPHIASNQPAIDCAATNYGRGGGRIASPAYRASLAVSNDFAGLEETTNRYDLLLLVKKVGKLAGFTPRMIQLLDYYLAFTRDVDWGGGESADRLPVTLSHGAGSGGHRAADPKTRTKTV